MTATGHHPSAVPRAVLCAVLVLLVAVAGLACAQSGPVAGNARFSAAGSAALGAPAALGASADPSHTRGRTAGGDIYDGMYDDTYAVHTDDGMYARHTDDPAHAGHAGHAGHRGTAASPTGCSGKDRKGGEDARQAEAPAPTRHVAPAPAPSAGPGAPAPGDSGARVVPGRGGPAPPPSPPSLEVLSVRRV